MFSFLNSRLLLFPLLGSLAVPSFATTPHYCIASGGGFGHGGTTYIGTGFALPADGICTAWTGFTKTAGTVILTTTGTGCVSSDGKVLTVSVINADPSYLGAGQVQADYIRLSRSSTSEGFGGGQDSGYFAGTADPTSCTSSLLSLPDSHD